MNYVATLWNVGNIFLFVPIYIHLLGDASFGVVSYSATIQAFLILFDLGIANTLKRELATDRSNKYKIDLVRTSETIYVLILGIFILFALTVPLFGQILISSELLSISEINISLQLIILMVGLQMMFSIYFGGLWGMNRTIEANIFQMGLSLFKNGGVALFIFLTGLGLISFFFYQLVVLLFFILITRFKLYLILKEELNDYRKRFSRLIIKENLNYSGGLLLISVIAAVNYQSDKLILGSSLPIEEYSYYYITFTLSQIPVILTAPIISVFFPSLTFFCSTGNEDGLKKLFVNLSLIGFCISALITVNIILANEDIIYLWTRNITYAEKGSIILPLIAFGGFMQATSLMPFQLALAYKDSKIIYQISLGILLLSFPTNVYLISHLGAYGAAIGWLFYNIISTPLMAFMVLKKHRSIKEFLSLYGHLALIVILIFSTHLLVAYFLSSFNFPNLVIGLLLKGILSLISSLFILNRIYNFKRIFTELRGVKVS